MYFYEIFSVWFRGLMVWWDTPTTSPLSSWLLCKVFGRVKSYLFCSTSRFVFFLMELRSGLWSMFQCFGIPKHWLFFSWIHSGAKLMASLKSFVHLKDHLFARDLTWWCLQVFLQYFFIFYVTFEKENGFFLIDLMVKVHNSLLVIFPALFKFFMWHQEAVCFWIWLKIKYKYIWILQPMTVMSYIVVVISVSRLQMWKSYLKVDGNGLKKHCFSSNNYN